MGKKQKTIKVIPGPPFAGHPGQRRTSGKGCAVLALALASLAATPFVGAAVIIKEVWF